MTRKILIAIAIIALFSNCGSTTKETTEKIDTTPVEQQDAAPIKLIGEVDGYFVTFKPKYEEVLVQEKTEWEANFHVAKTMDNTPTTIDFDKQKVGVIIAPETEMDTEIVINKASVEERKLIVDYSINTKGEKRSFTIVPMKAFVFELALDIDSISFVKNGVASNLPK